MQINRNMSAVMANNQLLRTENKLTASMERLSSGLKINHASDNPAGMAISNKMKAQIDALDQAEANTSNGISVLQIADGALNEVTDILQRMRELAVQAANGTNSYADRESMQAEIDELKKEVNRISKDTEYNTKALLDGSSDVRVYGDNASRYQVSDSVAARVYQMDVVEAATQATIELDYASPTAAGSISMNGVTVDVSAGIDKETYLSELRSAAEQAGCTVELNDAGDKILVKSNYYGYDESVEFSMSKEMAEAINLQVGNDDCAYEVQQVEMTFPADVPAESGIVSMNGVEVEIEAGMDSADYAQALKDAAKTAGLEAVVNADNTITVKAANEELVDFSYSYNLAVSMNIVNNYSGEYTVNTQGTDAEVTIPGDATSADNIALRESTGFTTTTTIETKGNKVIITDNNGFEMDFLLDAGFVSIDPNDPTKVGTFEVEVTDIGSLTIQVGANEHQDMDVRIGEVSCESLYVDTVDVAVEKGADRAMYTLDEAINELNAIRSRIGAFQNRLEYAERSLAATNENMTSAYSGLIDTDMAEEMTEYTQQNILDQAAVSVLSQANELPQQVLSLLQ